MSPSGSGRVLKTTDKSLAILEFVHEREGATMATICSALDLTKSTAHGHLTTLLNRGYLVKHGERYHLGMKLLKFGEAAKNRDDAFPVIRDGVDVLAERVEEGVDYSVLENDRIISVYDTITNENDPNFSPGREYLVHSTGAGKAILAELSDERVLEIIDATGLPALTDETITSRERLLKSLEGVRERGYAINDEEYQEGLRAIATVVTDPNGGVCGAIGIGGPTYRIRGDVFREDLPSELLRTVSEVEERLATVYDSP
jgi:IclR family transcriptional regulator, acetate operon repressor